MKKTFVNNTFAIGSLIATFIMMWTTSCNKAPRTGFVYCEEYIDKFITVDPADKLIANMTQGKDGLIIKLSVSPGEGRKKVIPIKQMEREKCLHEHYGDTNFNNMKLPNDIAYGQPIREISVICEEYFDEKHPTGSSLNDIIYFLGGSYMPFIQSGYKIQEKHVESILTQLPQKLVEVYKLTTPTLAATPLYCSTSEVNEDKALLLRPDFFLYLRKYPERGGTYHVRLSITFGACCDIEESTIEGSIVLTY